MPRVISGLERWLGSHEDGEPVPSGARLGVVAHAASVDSLALHTVHRLRESGRFRIERLFAPEHGVFGHEQDMETVASSADRVSGIPIVSLYGDSAESLRPTAEDFEGPGLLISVMKKRSTPSRVRSNISPPPVPRETGVGVILKYSAFSSTSGAPTGRSASYASGTHPSVSFTFSTPRQMPEKLSLLVVAHEK